ncbi:Adaptive-response sensory-kinase SasA [Emticicia aquatica]|uniref:histidine kinase n=1 Tax=Emticicia aquatica TaxID=1681835 RepID=A0ABM9AUL6_9BACT|nr:ATP-binding protein [Emticicia aquatica]CAH0997739.1 Adaptive-response sensory-kinase SasA [Emticicia aquatica]
MNCIKILPLTFFLFFTLIFSHAQEEIRKQTDKDIQDNANYESAKKLIEEQKTKEGLLKLEQSLAKSPNDYNKINMLLLEATVYRRMGDYDNFRKYLAKIDLKKADVKQTLKVYNFTSYVFTIQNSIDSAIFYAKKGIELSKKNQINSGDFYNNLSYFYKEKGDSFNQLLCIKNAYEEFVKKGDSTDIIYALYAIGDYYMVEGQLDKAKKYILECIGIQLKTNFAPIKQFDGFNQSYSQILAKQKDYYGAIKYAQKALDIDTKYNDKKGQVYSNNILATSYLSLNKLGPALKYAEEAVKIANETNFLPVLVISNTLLGEIYAKLGKDELAVETLKKAVKYSKEANDYVNLAESNKLLSSIYKKQKKYELALYYTEQYKMSNDSLLSSQNRKKAVTLLAQFESEQKDNKILSQELELAKEVGKINNLKILILSVVAIAMFLLFTVIYIRNRNRQKVSVLLANMQQDLISFQNVIAKSFRKSASEISLLGENTFEAILLNSESIAKKEHLLDAEEQAFFNDIKHQLNDIKEDLETRINKVKTFSYSISHDLKEPLNQALQLANRLKDDKFDVIEIQDYLKQANDLVKAYTELGEIEAYDICLQELDLSDLIKSEIKKVKKLPFYRSSCQINLDKLSVIYGDALLVRQVIWNLISNAVKYSQKIENSVINISTYKETNDEITIQFSDNGIGFPSELGQKLFTPFVRHGSVKSYEGFGMGLALCKQIVDKLGGKIWAQSDGESGANFFVTFKKTASAI